MMNVLELILETGEWSIAAFWIPLLVWTVIALPAYVVVRFGERISPQVRYAGSLALLASLPLGMIASWLTMWDPQGIGDAAVVVLPSIAYTPPATEAGSTFAWTVYHSAGTAVLLVGALAVWRGAALALAYAGLRRYRTHASAPAPAWLEALVRDLGRRIGDGGRVEVAVSEGRVSPLTFGWRRPVVVVPARLLDAKDDLELALVHELTHVRRRDYVLQWLEHFVGAVFFAHPLVALLRHETSILREITCDADVLARLTDRARYARLLFRYSASSDTRWSMAVGILLREHHLKKRIRAMKPFLDFNKLNRSKRIGLLASGSLLILAVAAVACSDTIVHPTASDDLERGARPAEVFVVVEEMPELIGGLESIQKNLVYPELAKNAGVEGRIIVQFVVDEEGAVQNPKIVRGIGSGLDEAALEAVRTAKFRPGRQRGEAVKVRMSLPVTFKLGGPSPGTQEAPPPPRELYEVPGGVFGRDAIQESMQKLSERSRIPPPEADVPPAPPRPDEPFQGDVYPTATVDQMPELEGGLASLQRDLKYPEIARRAGIEGRVIVEFVVDENGDVRDARIVRGIGAGVDEEALRVVRSARFTPGRDRGEPVSVRMALPFTFKLPTDGGQRNVVRISIDDNNEITLNDEPVRLSELGSKIRAAGVSKSTVVTLVVSGGASMGVVSDVQEELRSSGALRIEYSKTP